MTSNETSSLFKIASGAMKKTDPGLVAQIIGGVVTKDPFSSEPAARLAQMAMGAIPPAVEEFMAATYRQHALETLPFHLVSDDGNPIFLSNKNNHNKITLNKKYMAKSYGQEIAIADDLKKYLNNLQEKLNIVSMNYWSKSNDLSQAGMMEEVYSEFVQDYVSETTRKITEVVSLINERDIPFIERYIAYLDSRP